TGCPAATETPDAGRGLPRALRGSAGAHRVAGGAEGAAASGERHRGCHPDPRGQDGASEAGVTMSPSGGRPRNPSGCPSRFRQVFLSGLLLAPDGPRLYIDLQPEEQAVGVAVQDGLAQVELVKEPGNVFADNTPVPGEDLAPVSLDGADPDLHVVAF